MAQKKIQQQAKPFRYSATFNGVGVKRPFIFMLLSDYKEDAQKQESGSPCYLGNGCFYVRRVGGKQYLEEVEIIKRNLYGFSPTKIDQNEVMAHWLAEYGVTGWDDIMDGNDDNKPVEYSKKNARIIFLDKSYWQSLNIILFNHGSDYNNYLEDAAGEDVEQVKKN